MHQWLYNISFFQAGYLVALTPIFNIFLIYYIITLYSLLLYSFNIDVEIYGVYIHDYSITMSTTYCNAFVALLHAIS